MHWIADFLFFQQMLQGWGEVQQLGYNSGVSWGGVKCVGCVSIRNGMPGPRRTLWSWTKWEGTVGKSNVRWEKICQKSTRPPIDLI